MKRNVTFIKEHSQLQIAVKPERRRIVESIIATYPHDPDSAFVEVIEEQLACGEWRWLWPDEVEWLDPNQDPIILSEDYELDSEGNEVTDVGEYYYTLLSIPGILQELLRTGDVVFHRRNHHDIVGT